ncbi:MAG TPA: response regulator transcription factor [Candidatus Methylomirabilis sp.]|nr:response regulator transcription factor [Candidatus Methylomirabilis sp.]
MCDVVSDVSKRGGHYGDEAMRVLVVDDSAIVGERIAAMLSEFTEIELLDQVKDGLEAVERIRTLSPDVVILDIGLPGRNGIEVLGDVKREKLVPIVMILTNYPYPQYQQRCVDAGADFFLDKSIEFDRVLQIFKQLIHGSSMSMNSYEDFSPLKSKRIQKFGGQEG